MELQFWNLPSHPAPGNSQAVVKIVSQLAREASLPCALQPHGSEFLFLFFPHGIRGFTLNETNGHFSPDMKLELKKGKN